MDSTTKKNRLRYYLGWTSLAIGVLVIGGAGAMHGVATTRQNEALDQRAYDFEGYQNLANSGNTFRSIGHVGIAVGTVGIGVGISALLLSRTPSKYGLSCRVPIKETR